MSGKEVFAWILAIVVALFCVAGGIGLLAAKNVSEAIRARSKQENKQVVFDIHGLHFGEVPSKEFVEKHLHGHFDAQGTLAEQIEGKPKDLVADYEFSNGKLVGLHVWFNSLYFTEVSEAYSVKFGTNPVRKTETKTNAMGATFTNQVLMWNTDAGQFIVEKYYNTISQGCAYMVSDEINERVKMKQIQQASKLESKL